jgi:hypothetical protein
MRYSLHEIDKYHVVATTVAAERDEALEWFSEKLRLMLTFEGDPLVADYLLDEWPEGLLAHTSNPTIPVFVSQRSKCTPSGISRRWMWSGHCVSSDDRFSSTTYPRVFDALERPTLSGTPKDARDEILERFADGEIEVVTKCQVLTEGWDCPSVEVCILAK